MEETPIQTKTSLQCTLPPMPCEPKDRRKSKRTKRIECRVTPTEYEIIQHNNQSTCRLGKSVSAYLCQAAVFGLILVADDDAMRWVESGLKILGNQMNEAAKLANRTGSISPNDAKDLFEKINLVWYILANIYCYMMREEREVEKTESNWIRVICFHPFRKKKNPKTEKATICLKSYVTEKEYALIKQRMELCSCKSVSDYLRRMAVYGFCFDLSKINPSLEQSVSYAFALDNNFRQILRVIGDDESEKAKYDFGDGWYNIPNITRRVKDICRILKFCQSELH